MTIRLSNSKDAFHGVAVMAPELHERSVSELLPLLARGDVTAEALTGHFLQAIRQRDPKVRAFLHVDETAALDQARAVDAKRKQGAKLGSLAGVPVAIKDVL